MSWFCRDLCLIGGWRGSISHGYICIVLYIYRCAKCGVAVFKASMLGLGVGGQSAMGICALFYIYRSVIRCAKFGVVVFKVSMLDWRRGWGWICHRSMCIVLYISASRSAKFGVVVFHGSMVNEGGGSSGSRSAKCAVVVFKASLYKWQSICHRSMPHCYTSPLPIDHRSMLHYYTSLANQP